MNTITLGTKNALINNCIRNDYGFQYFQYNNNF